MGREPQALDDRGIRPARVTESDRLVAGGVGVRPRQHLPVLRKVLFLMHFSKLVELSPARDVVAQRHRPYTRALFDALPSLDPARRSLPILRDGADASPFAPLHGCAYFARCPNAERGRCDLEVPPLKETTERSRHRVACWHPFND